MQSQAGRVYRPSSGTQTTQELVSETAKELVQKRLGLTAPKIVIGDSAVATGFKNADEERMKVDWPSFWDFYARELKEGHYLESLKG
jgi:hypothetical protein